MAKKQNGSKKKTKKKASTTAPVAGIGHNQPPEDKKTKTKTKKGGQTGAAVRKYVKAIENLMEDARDIALDKAELFKAAKENGLDTKALRRLIAQRRQDTIEMQQLQETVDSYEHAME